jgi:3-oxoacyl-[acyl-carrier protein] reductase
MARLTGKGAVVTGGSRGIGRAIVRRLAADGATVVFNYATSAGDADSLAAEVDAAGGRAHPVRADLAERGAVDRLLEVAGERLDGYDILVNNAALDDMAGPIADLAEEAWDRTMTVNVRSAFLTVRHAARTMRDGGRIVNMSTLNTVRPAPGIAAYAASKGALEQLTRVAAVELGPRGITVNAVCPGATDTALLRDNNPAEALAQIPAMTPLRRLGQPDDIADVVAMLVGHDGRWITGQVILATGGL